jgi:hypothetical protein
MDTKYRYRINNHSSGSGYVVAIEASQPAKCGEWLVVNTFRFDMALECVVKLAGDEVRWLKYQDDCTPYNFSCINY